jgi:hypothetical protein
MTIWNGRACLMMPIRMRIMHDGESDLEADTEAATEEEV